MTSLEMTLGQYLGRLTATSEALEYEIERREDLQLIKSLEAMSFGADELDSLFERIEKAFRATVVFYVAGLIFDGAHLDRGNGSDDPFYRALDLLRYGKATSEDATTLPKIDLLGDGSDKEGLGLAGWAQVELVRRLVNTTGLAELRAEILAESRDISSLRLLQTSSANACSRLLRLVAPIEREHMLSLLLFLSPTGQVVESHLKNGQQTPLEFFMRVDK